MNAILLNEVSYFRAFISRLSLFLGAERVIPKRLIRTRARNVTIE